MRLIDENHISKSPQANPIVRDEVFHAYWSFAWERQRIFEARLRGDEGPWTEDPILQVFRFCNSFRASDRVSQYLIREVIYGLDDLTNEDLFLRVTVFRLFSKPETWELLEDSVGEIRASTFDADACGRVLDAAMAGGHRIYTAAFILAPSPFFGHARKHHNHLALVDAQLKDGAAARIASASTLEDVYNELLRWPMIGPFLAYQIATDLNYSELIDFNENQFTMPGPGAMRGLAKVFTDLNGLSPQEAIYWLVDAQHSAPAALGLEAPTLFGRPLHAIDCQNLLCEVDKYSRVAFPELLSGRMRIKQTFRPVGQLPAPFYPPKWELEV